MIELNRSSKTKKRKAFISIALVLALAITGALAFLTARDSAENKFTVGNVKIDLTEPSWDENTAKNIVSGQIIEKDPTITNRGRNDAYVYMMVEIPKAIETDIVSTDESGNEITTTETNYPLFSFAANEGWTLIDSQIGTEIDAYDYYLYGYNTALTPGSSATLFNEVAFANVTSEFVDTYADESNELSLDINVTGYAIQSDYYNGEANDASTAWELYVNQNSWTWPNKKYAGLSTLSFMSEDGEIVNTETAYAGTPVEMYFEPSLAKDGYTFDWVDEATSEVAYSGMPMPEEDTTLTATYTETGYGDQVTTGLHYNIKYSDTYGLYASLSYQQPNSIDYTQFNNQTVVIPSTIAVSFSHSGDTVNASSTEATVGATALTSASLVPEYGVELTIPVMEIGSLAIGGSDKSLDPQAIVIPDSVVMYSGFLTSNGTSTSYAKYLNSITLPYGVKELPKQAFNNAIALETVNLPASLERIGERAFYGCTALVNITIPDSVTSIGDWAFYKCDALTDITIGNGVTNIGDCAFYLCKNITSLTIGNRVTNIGKQAFCMCRALTDITIPDSVTNISSYAFDNCTNLTAASVPSTCTVASNAFPSTCTVTYR